MLKGTETFLETIEIRSEATFLKFGAVILQVASGGLQRKPVAKVPLGVGRVVVRITGHLITDCLDSGILSGVDVQAAGVEQGVRFG